MYVQQNSDRERTNHERLDLPQDRLAIIIMTVIIIYFLMQALKFHIACDMTAQEVHDLGQNEVKRIRSRMDKV